MVFHLFSFHNFSFNFLFIMRTLVDLLLSSILCPSHAASTISLVVDLHAHKRKLHLCLVCLLHTQPLPCAFFMRSCVLEQLLMSRAALSASVALDPSDQPARSPSKVARVLHASPQPMLVQILVATLYYRFS